jgi:hypothetical protein
MIFLFAGVDTQRYIGCYRDGLVNGQQQRVMNYPRGVHDSLDMTVNSCLEKCRLSPLTYAGVEVLYFVDENTPVYYCLTVSY